ncbi:MOP flippase family protein [Leptothoe spongobia TAU-MAC 1115]|uniref:MOP flippase family protein n=1 Tax=Leptothoe spongobia TAU-MAC 1115 TaxID=1967444 RepID=A0A947DCS8_9CYAN|nr:MOP flippase family protein [Leptothoe spongobia TAU-MAC 1115]
MSLREKATSGIKWSAISQVGRQVMQFFTTAVLARLLSPDDFGLLGMATIVIGFVNLFKDLGTSSAIIQKSEISDSLVHSIFWVNVAFGIAGTLVLLLVAPLIAAFYSEPRLIPVLRLLSLTFGISGLSILQKALLEKDLAFNALAKIELAAVVLGALIGIGMAFMGLGVWSLVYQAIVVAGVTTLLTLGAIRWRPKLFFSLKDIQQVSSYSLNLTGFNIFNFFARNADYLLIGKFLGTEALGYYTLAYRLMLYPLQNISTVITRVMFPTFVQIQNDNVRFKQAYLKVVSTIALVTFPMMMGLLVLSEPFVMTFFGDKWQPVILLLMILSPVGLLQSIVTTVGTIYTAKGRTDWMFIWGVGSGLVVTTAIAIGLRWDIIGVATAYAIAVAVLSYHNFAIPFQLIELRVRNMLRVLWRPFMVSICMLAVLVGLKMWILPVTFAPSVVLAVLVVSGLTSYLLASWLLNQEQMSSLLTTFGCQKN